MATKGSGRPQLERFMERVMPEPNSGCWLWTGALTRDGYACFEKYGDIATGGGAHRFAFLALRGSVPGGQHLDHLCRVRCCVNPWHLEAVSPYENTLRSVGNPVAINALKTHCQNGHPLTDGNVRRYKQPRSGWNARICRRCCAERMALIRRAKKAFVAHSCDQVAKELGWA